MSDYPPASYAEYWWLLANLARNSSFGTTHAADFSAFLAAQPEGILAGSLRREWRRALDKLERWDLFHLALQRYPGHLDAAQTIAFVTLCTSELLRAFTARSEYNSIFSIGLFSNRWMVWAVAVSFLLVLAVVYVPFLSPFFYTVPLTLDDLLFMLPFFLASPVAMEIVKFHFRRRTAAAVA